ncbi:glycosyltransferase [Luteimonas suaedae]|uniref:glycosyltransferase n=1 Tax=Luteimonas suaedae TaxID=2605430 RepID=UPI001658C619|nr:glycosyltransferase [Luteimonas suaedae]
MLGFREDERADLPLRKYPEAPESVPVPQMDPCWYKETYPDVGRVPLEPETHFQLYGHRLGRDPSPEFSTVFFRALLKLGERKDPLRELRKLSVRGLVPKNPAFTGRVLWAAEQLAHKDRLDQALVLAERWLPTAEQYRTNILRANLAVKHNEETAWIAATNAYLRHFGLAPIQLQGRGSLFDRVQSQGLTESVRGPRVSIIVAAWNSEHTVAKALDSLLAQSWQNIELLVIDDCSTDGTWGVISEISARDSRVKAWRNPENVGPYVSKSIAASYATGDWITCHDADDWAHPERIARQAQFCIENRLTACLSGMLRMDNKGEYTRLNEVGEFVHDGACRSAFISLFMCSQTFHDLLGAWDQVRAGGDSELLRRLEIVTGKCIHQLPVPTMLCRDHEQSLTNDTRFGLNVRTDDGARHRLIYKNSYLQGHKSLTRSTSRYEFPERESRYDSRGLQVPLESVLNATAAHQAQLQQEVVADVVIITNTRFPGGNASSTLDELRYLKSQGLRVALVHCSVDTDLGRSLSTRFNAHREVLYQWSRVASISAKVLICRHPRVLVSHAFRYLLPRIQAKHAFVVKNNSCRRPSGESVYELEDMVRVAQALSVESLQFCPISQVMRNELLEYPGNGIDSFRLSAIDWTPTFDAAQYYHPPKAAMCTPYKVGRHSRDGMEKWRERPKELLQAYPPSSDFEIHILGGAAKAVRILGELPENWRVREFGEVEPLAFLARLDAFVYFPNTNLVEGFGRTIVEAMIAGVPVIVPASLEENFGELVLVCEPRDVAVVVARLAQNAEARISYLKEVQQLALARYGADIIAERLRGTGLELAGATDTSELAILSARSRHYRSTVLREL